MEKILNYRSVSMALGLGIGTLMLGACGSVDDESGDIISPAATTADTDLPQAVAEYYTNGTRTIRYEYVDGDFADIFQFCDGPDLVEQTEFLKHGYGAAGNSVERSVGHAACADSKLTEEDFALGARG